MIELDESQAGSYDWSTGKVPKIVADDDVNVENANKQAIELALRTKNLQERLKTTTEKVDSHATLLNNPHKVTALQLKTMETYPAAYEIVMDTWFRIGTYTAKSHWLMIELEYVSNYDNVKFVFCPHDMTTTGVSVYLVRLRGGDVFSQFKVCQKTERGNFGIASYDFYVKVTPYRTTWGSYWKVTRNTDASTSFVYDDGFLPIATFPTIGVWTTINTADFTMLS